jgi:type IV pilus assembly protein PilW
MRSILARPIHLRPRSQRGFTLIELMIAVLIALFLSAGLLTLVQAMKATAGAQSGLSQLQDNERMAMTLIADVIQSAGYFPNPTLNTAVAEFSVAPANGLASAFTTPGQSVAGAGNYGDPPLPASPSNSVTVRYATAGMAVVPPATPDNIVNCTGNTSAVATTFTNTFSLLADPSIPGTYDLVCQLSDSTAGTTTTVYLVSGVTQMQIYYGVQTNTGVTTGSVDTYLDANTVTAGNYWGNVVSVKVTLTFVNPLYGNLAGQLRSNTPQTIAFTRVIDVMNKAN